MARFVQIKVESKCCQSYGICGEQYAQDVIFDDEGRVTTSRFRFQHQVQKTQADYIKGLVETRKACDLYSSSLTTYPDSVINGSNLDSQRFAVHMDVPAPANKMRKWTNYMGITEPQMLKA